MQDAAQTGTPGRDGDARAEAFITCWQGVAASELSTSQSFLIDLCRLLEVYVPHPTPEQDYMFERPITFSHGDGSTSAGRIDLYRRGASRSRPVAVAKPQPWPKGAVDQVRAVADLIASSPVSLSLDEIGARLMDVGRGRSGYQSWLKCGWHRVELRRVVGIGLFQADPDSFSGSEVGAFSVSLIFEITQGKCDESSFEAVCARDACSSSGVQSTG